MTDETVVAFPAKPSVVKAVAEPQTVTLLEELLAEARAGKIACIGVVTVRGDNFVGSAVATNGGPHAHSLVAGALYLLRRCERFAGADGDA